MNILLVIIYLAFISLGLPDSLLGSAWPTIYNQINVPLSYSGIIFMIISLGTIISSLNSDRINRRFSTGVVTAVSTGMAAFRNRHPSVSAVILRMLGISLVKLLRKEFPLCGGFPVGDALLHFDHLRLAEAALAHGQQRAEEAEDREAVAQEHGHPEHARRGGIVRLGHGCRIADQGNTAGGDRSRKGGDDLIYQAVGAGHHGGDVLAAAIQLEIDDIGHKAGVGGGDAHRKAVDRERQHNKEDLEDQRSGDGRGTHCMACDDEEGDHRDIRDEAVARPCDNGFLVAVLAGVAGPDDRKQNGRQHADHAESGGKAHIADEDAV